MSADAPRPDTTRLQRLVHSYRDAAALMAAVELGLFTHVARGADTEAALTRALDVTPTNAERLVTACVALGLLVRDGEAGNGRLRNAPDVARFVAGFLVFVGAVSVAVIVMLQSWQGNEHAKMSYLVGDFSNLARSALRRKPKLSSDIHRYFILLVMLLYIVVLDVVIFRLLADIGR